MGKGLTFHITDDFESGDWELEIEDEKDGKIIFTKTVKDKDLNKYIMGLQKDYEEKGFTVSKDFYG